MCYHGGLKLTDLSHHLGGLGSLRLRVSSQLVVLSPQSLQLLSDVVTATPNWSALSLHPNFGVFAVFLRLASVQRDPIAGRSMDTSEMFVEIFLSREALSCVTFAI
jgi:hypothetical protein